MTFDDLPLDYDLLDGLDAMNFTEPTPVQEQAIPLIIEGHDVIACAQTGTGKTAAYTLPLLHNLLHDDHDPSRINAIIMAPTRELAQQIDQQIEGFGYYVPCSSVAVYGGNDGQAWTTQRNGLLSGADIVIATPGRLLSHLNVQDIDFSGVKYFILDEADRMLDMGFIDDIMTVVNRLPAKRQTIMFSATMPDKIRQLAKTIMHQPAEVRIAVSRPPESIHQSAYVLHENQKLPLIKQLLTAEKLNKVLLFAGKKQTVKEVTRTLGRIGVHTDQMHSDLTQQQRDHVMHEYRSGRIDVLVATDIVSRGIDIDDIPLVINYDVPRDAEDYVHRIGRTARAANTGSAITLVNEADQTYFRQIEQFLGRPVEKLPLPEQLGPAPEYRPQSKSGKNPAHRRNRSRKPTSNQTQDQHRPSERHGGRRRRANRSKSENPHHTHQPQNPVRNKEQ